MKYFDLSLDRFQVWDGFFVGFLSFGQADAAFFVNE